MPAGYLVEYAEDTWNKILSDFPKNELRYIYILKDYASLSKYFWDFAYIPITFFHNSSNKAAFEKCFRWKLFQSSN